MSEKLVLWGGGKVLAGLRRKKRRRADDRPARRNKRTVTGEKMLITMPLYFTEGKKKTTYLHPEKGEKTSEKLGRMEKKESSTVGNTTYAFHPGQAGGGPLADPPA